MGLWDWLIDRLFASSSEKAAHEPSAHERIGRNRSSVAVLDHPDEPQAADSTEAATPWYAPEGATLLEFVSPGRPHDMAPESRALENLLVSHFDGHNLKLPPLHQVAERVLPRLSSRECSLNEVAQELATDSAIAAAVLRMSNSPMYRGVEKITSLQVAVSRLGTRALRMLLLHESLRTAVFPRKGVVTEFARGLWERSLASGCIMRGLASGAPAEKEDAFLIGLLHDVGNVVALRIIYGDIAAPRYQGDVDTLEFLCFESHQEFGELIADAWGLSAKIKSLASDHHAEPAADDAYRTERLQLQVTDMIASLLGFAPFAAYNLLESRPVQELGLHRRSSFVAYLDRLPDEIEGALGEL